jgi:hypothetical protein
MSTEDARADLSDLLVDALAESGVDDNCPVDGEVLETGVRVGTHSSGEVHLAAGAVCPECGFAAAYTTAGEPRARGRTRLEWPDEPDEPGSEHEDADSEAGE